MLPGQTQVELQVRAETMVKKHLGTRLDHQTLGQLSKVNLPRR
jgi:hypothetical protein